MDEPEILTGGNSNQVTREGNTVVRKTGRWSPSVHALLRTLQANGFTEAPVLLQSSDTQERLSFLEGDVGHYPLKAFMREDAIVIEAATLLRKFHDLTENFVVPPDAQFFLPQTTTDYEVICHNDFAPYNCVFKEGHLTGIIDFDTAFPGSRLWDVAYAVYRFAPLVTDEHCFDMGWPTAPDRGARLKLFCDTYGLDNRAALIETVIQRLETMIQFMKDHAANPEHIPIYLADLGYIRDNQMIWSQGIL